MNTWMRAVFSERELIETRESINVRTNTRSLFNYRLLPFSLLLALWPLSLSSVMLATLRTGSADPRCSRSRLRSWFSRLKLRLVTWSRFRSRSSRLSSLLSNRSPLRFERSKSLRSRLELFLQEDKDNQVSRSSNTKKILSVESKFINPRECLLYFYL